MILKHISRMLCLLISYSKFTRTAGCRHLKWTAYTYLVDLPSRMNSNKLKFLGGYSWGYEEDENGPQRLLPLEILTENDWEKHATEKGILKISQITGGCTAKL